MLKAFIPLICQLNLTHLYDSQRKHSIVDRFEGTVYMLLCRRWKRSFSVMLTSQRRFTSYQSVCSGLFASREDILLFCFLLSKFECRIPLSNIELHHRTLNFECYSIFMWTGMSSKTLLLLMWTRIFLYHVYMDIKVCIFKDIRMRVDVALISSTALSKG